MYCIIYIVNNESKIIIKGARTHNLKNINVEIPRNKLVVITGLSGSGKSSLAFDTIYAEGQRRYVESLSAYARQFLEQMQKPDVDSIDGLSPAISIEQKSPGRNPRSTVGTVTEIYDYLRLLFANIGIPHCPNCGKKIEKQSPTQITDRIMTLKNGEKIQILAPLVSGRKGEYKELFERTRKEGFVRIRVNGKIYDLSEEIKLDKQKKHSIEIVVDRIKVTVENRKRLFESVETALRFGNGLVLIDAGSKEPMVFSEKFACPDCGISIEEVTPRIFSFNSPFGACPKCTGLGSSLEFDPDLVIPFMSPVTCSACKGTRLKPESLAVKIAGINISKVSKMDIEHLHDFIDGLKLTENETTIARQILKEIKLRLKFLLDVGLNYLSLNRETWTLSGGEAQRTRLATQIGSGLVGVLYILDEPSIGLHQRDNSRLIKTLKNLRDLGNTVIVVEHDEGIMRSSDHIVDIGPGAGVHGGRIIAQGHVSDIIKNKNSITGRYLCGDMSIATPEKRRGGNGKSLVIKGARHNNLKNINVAFPLGKFICVTGVSGSGKSSLINDILYNALSKKFYRSLEKAGTHDGITGIENIDKVIIIDQSSIGRTPRSNPATYTGVFDHIRNIFALTEEARARGYQKGRFSFNVKGGRCENCGGGGLIKIEMHFLPDVYMPCDVCSGMRYNKETLDVRYRGHNISGILDMTVEEALELFDKIPQVKSKLKTLYDVGLGYIRLGQAATTLSGGEAQRVKLSTELSHRSTGKTLYILDEPTTGLHFHDVAKLLEVLNRLVDAGNTVIVIEHNLDVIKFADHIIDLGKEGGDKGGYLVGEGTPEELIKNRKSYTGQYLKKVLK